MSAFDDAWADFEDQAGPLMADGLSQHAPVGDPDLDEDSGTLANSMEWRDQEGVLTAGSSDPRGPIARFVARGTRPHSIDPVNGEFLTFFWPKVGHVVKMRHVDHPGTTANPFHIDTWESIRPEVQQMFRDTVGGGTVLSYLNPWKNRTLGEE
jgi:hypothetical protein